MNCHVLLVLQHYPLFRVSDAGCTGVDAAPPQERHLLFREKYDVLSKEASQRVSPRHRLVPPTLLWGLLLLHLLWSGLIQSKHSTTVCCQN